MIGRWMFFKPWWASDEDVLISRATLEDIANGSWLFSSEHSTPATLDDIEAWLSDRAGHIIRQDDRIEWFPGCEDVDFETRMRWW